MNVFMKTIDRYIDREKQKKNNSKNKFQIKMYKEWFQCGKWKQIKKLKTNTLMFTFYQINV